MPAYVIVDAEVTDPEAYESYKQLSAEAVAAHGGRFLVRGGAARALEGDWTPSRVVVLEFASVEDAAKWYESEEYRAARQARASAARMNMVAVEGVR